MQEAKAVTGVGGVVFLYNQGKYNYATLRVITTAPTLHCLSLWAGFLQLVEKQKKRRGRGGKGSGTATFPHQLQAHELSDKVRGEQVQRAVEMWREMGKFSPILLPLPTGPGQMLGLRNSAKSDQSQKCLHE